MYFIRLLDNCFTKEIGCKIKMVLYCGSKLRILYESAVKEYFQNSKAQQTSKAVLMKFKVLK